MDRPAPHDLGTYGERLAARYLTESGYTIVARNWRCARGELDIIATEPGALVFCEVKTRSSELFGAPFEAVTRRKLGRLRRLCGLWLDSLGDGQRPPGDQRLDVISILKSPGGSARIEHLVGVS
ncbi:MAG: YraN family protein [Dermatophilaceae bacterium]